MIKDLRNTLHEHAMQLAFGFGDDDDVGMNIMMMIMMLANMAILEIMSMTMKIRRTFNSNDDCQPISDRQL